MKTPETRPLPPAAMQTFREAMAAHQVGRLDEAERLYRRVLKADGKQFPVLMMLGMLSAQRGNLAEAERLLRSALAINPGNAEAQYNYGNVLLHLGRFDDAFAAFGTALSLNPSLREAHLNRGSILMSQKRFTEAAACFDSAISIDPQYSEAHCNRGNALVAIRRYAEALASYDTALALNPRNAEFHASRANVLHSLQRGEEALGSLSKALSLQPGNAGFHYNLANILFDLRRFAEAFEAYDRSFNLEPRADYVEGDRFFAKMMICSWHEIQADTERLTAGVREGRSVARPFAFLTAETSQALQTRCANLFCDREFPSMSANRAKEKHRHDRIRVAYLSADFRDHPVSHLLAGMFEKHDHARFETMAVAFGAADQTPLRRRLESAFESFIDVDDKTDAEVAEMLRDREIDIAVDLMGPTKNARPGIFALRPAPVQVMYLGYAGSSGAPYVDYILADPIVIPEGEQGLFREKVIYLPETFMGTDDKREIATVTPTRQDEGLPPDGFVFCAFVNSYKISPQAFDVWMEILRQVENSVLWLSNANDTAMENLRREARSRGVRPERLVFARRVERNEDHLARHRLADLFLDTFPLGAHSTVADALWAGTPVLTYTGKTFGGRVATSLLLALGANELISDTTSTFTQSAVRIACDPQLLARTKEKVGSLRSTSPLFNTQRFTAHIEATYNAIWERHQRGESPSSFAVPPLASK
jgi:predicted O-linked N-acetylglucosamine transferase (SPINDLY family)